MSTIVFRADDGAPVGVLIASMPSGVEHDDDETEGGTPAVKPVLIASMPSGVEHLPGVQSP